MAGETLAVLHVVRAEPGGVPAYAAAAAADQVRRGWRVGVAGPDWMAADTAEAGAEGLHWEARREPGPGVLPETVRLSRLVRAFAPELVHLHSAKAGLAGRLALRGRLPTVYQPHAWSFEAARGATRVVATAWERLGARWADAVVCVSEAERARGEAVGVRARYRVVRNGVDLAAFAPASQQDRADARARLDLGDGPLAVCVGRLSRQKGQDVVLDAWPAVQAAVPGARVYLVGDGPERAALEARAADGVVLAGERSDVADWLAAADVVVSASRWEGLSLALLEALARGRSLVAADVPGAREVVGEDAGEVVPTEDPRALAAAVSARLLDPTLRAAEERAARARAEAHFDVRRTLDELAALYLELVRARPERKPAR